MPDKDCHLELARRNQVLIDLLLPAINDHSDWITTVAFYKALHIVEAIFNGNKDIQHGQSHPRREHFLKTDRRYQHIYRHYRPLCAASMIARYLENDNRTVASFSQFLSPEGVKSEILNHRLRQIENSARNTFSISIP
jgi:uncharacterized membrane protein